MSSLKLISHLSLPLLLASSLSGCGGMEEKRDKNFSDTTTLYKNALRWKTPAEQQAFFADSNNANLPSKYNMRIVEIQILGPATAISEDERILDSRLSYLKESNQSIQTLMDSQHWIWKGEEEGWRRSNPMPTPRHR